MALNRSNKYPGRFLAPTAARPQGAFKNRTSPTAQDGSYLEADWANDWDGFFARVLTVAGVTPNGNVDDGANSQLYNALLIAMPGRLIGRQIFTASGSYTPTPGTRYIKFRIAGGGGGGGGCPAVPANQQAAASGGQSGAYVEGVSGTISSTSSYGIVVGNAGTAGTSSSPATAGGASTIAGIVNVPGGAAGIQGVASIANLTLGNSSPGTVYATITSGAALVSLPANVGEPFTVVGNGVNQVRGGRGGSCPFGIGGSPGVGGPGQPPRGYGAGGGGCSQISGNAGDSGGSGSTGLIIIEEFS